MNTIDWLVLVVFSLGVFWLIKQFAVSWFIVKLAKIDSWWSPWRILPPPGEMYIVVRGDRTGPFDSILESVLDYHYDPDTHEFSYLSTPRVDDSELGVFWVGFFRYLKHPEVKYDKWEKKPDSAKWGVVPKDRKGPSVFFQYNMAADIEAAETVGNFPVDAVIVFTAQIINPVKAFFFAGGWEVQTTAAVAGLFRKHVAGLNIDQLREEQKVVGTTQLVEKIKSLNDGNSGLYELFGVKIIDARFVQFDLVSGDRDEEMIVATRATEIARLQAQADQHRGEGERNKRVARAVGVKAEVEAWGSNAVGGTIAMAEAIKEAKPNVLGGSVIASVDSERKSS